MKEVISKISVTTFAVVYLFFCGVLYLISYWSTFDFDVTNYIEILDIPKSFVFPLATGIGVSLITILIQAVVHSIEKIEADEKKDKELLPKIKELPTKTIFVRIISNYTAWAAIILFVCLVFYSPRREWVYAILSLTLIIFCISTFLKNDSVVKLVPRFSLRLILSILLFFIPIYSFMTGKLNAIDIWKNRKYFKVESIIFKDSANSNSLLVTRKLLGKLGPNLFLSDSLNTKILILNLDQVQSIEFKFVTKAGNAD